MSSFFLELSIVMLIVLLVSAFMQMIKQPLIVGYIFSGIIASPIFLNILSSTEGYETFAHIGIALLLFIVGLHLDLKLIKEVGLISLVTGFGQILFTSIFGFLLGLLLGFDVIASLIIAIALTFSSTIIIVKLLADKGDLDKLYGKISMGFLIVQDFAAVLTLMIISSLMTINPNENVYIELAKTIGFGAISIIITYFISKKFLPKLLNKIAKSTELLFVFIIAWCLGIANIFYLLGFSIEIGALLAGIALASSPYQSEISSKIKPLRDFFIVMFFILLGSQMMGGFQIAEGISFIEKMIILKEMLIPLMGPIIIFSIFILIGNPLIVMILMRVFNYNSKIGFKAGLTVAQISEFSLILATMSLKSGYLSKSDVTTITFVGIITITLSTYMMLNDNTIYKKLEKILKWLFDSGIKKEKVEIPSSLQKTDIIIFGYDRIGYSLLKTIVKMKKTYLIVDFNPEVINKLKKNNFNCVYGDAEDIEFLSEIDFNNSKIIISTIPEKQINTTLLNHIKKTNHNATIILTSHQIDEALELYKTGADYVILPHFLGGNYISTLIEKYDEKLSDFLNEKITHISELKHRKEHGFEHPKH